jgi:glutathione synthase/RimK-type ligase-like ATP-grasp enzyme
VEGKDPLYWGCLKPNIHAPLWEMLHENKSKSFREIDFRNAVIRSGKVYTEDSCLNELEGLFWYCEIDRRPGSYHLEILRTLAREISVFPDPGKWETAMDKFTSHSALRSAGLPVPEFALVDLANIEMLEPLFGEWGAAMLKPRRGGWGKGVTLITDFGSFRDISGYLHSAVGRDIGGGFFLERYYDNEPTAFASVTLLNGKVMYGYKKSCEKFVSLGNGRFKVYETDLVHADAKWTPLGSEQIELAEKAAAVLDCPIIGFDLLSTSEGYLIVDENTSPGNYPAVYTKVGKDPAAEFSQMIYSKFPI